MKPLNPETIFSDHPLSQAGLIVEQNPGGEWQAYETSWDWGDPIGYGSTPEEAVADLKEQLEDEIP
ncbi:MAG TPA: hypothetical protein VF202_03060 [Trueperaceae bacterium]